MSDFESFVSAYIAHERGGEYVFCFGRSGEFICAERLENASVRSVIGTACRFNASAIAWVRHGSRSADACDKSRLAAVAKTIAAAERLNMTFIDYMESGTGFSLRRALGYVDDRKKGTAAEHRHVLRTSLGGSSVAVQGQRVRVVQQGLDKQAE